MKCEEVKELLWPYLAQEGNEEEAKAISVHLESCSKCAKEAEEIKAAMAALESLPEEELPQGFHEGLMARLAQEQKVVPFAAKKKPQPKWKQYSLVAAAAVLVVAVGGAQGILDMRNGQNEAAMGIESPQSTSGAQTELSTDGGGEVAIVAEEDREQGTSANSVEEEKAIETPKIVSDKKPKQNAEESPRTNQAVAPKGTETPVPGVQNTAEGKPAEDLPMVAAEGGRALRAVAPGDVFSEEGQDNGIVAYERVTLEVKSIEGVREELVTRATALGGYEAATPKENSIFLAIPQEHAQSFYDELLELGTPGQWEKPTETETMLFFDIMLQEEKKS